MITSPNFLASCLSVAIDTLFAEANLLIACIGVVQTFASIFELLDSGAGSGLLKDLLTDDDGEVEVDDR